MPSILFGVNIVAVGDESLLSSCFELLCLLCIVEGQKEDSVSLCRN